MNEILLIFLAIAAGTWFSAAFGAGLIVFVKKGNVRMTNVILGFAAGVILMVTFLELIHPAIHIAEVYSPLPAWVVVPLAFAAGFLGTFLLDVSIDRRKKRKEAEGKGSLKYKRGYILLSTLATHNIPEGLALGVLMGALGNNFQPEYFLAVIPMVIAVGLHKFPEGTAISVAFQNEGMSKTKSFLVGQLSGFLGFLSGIAGFVVAVSINAILPYAMAFAGGALVWVAVHELIPESKSEKQTSPYLSTMGLFFGVMLMLFVDITLHDHSHGHSHDHSHSHGEYHHHDHDHDHDH